MLNSVDDLIKQIMADILEVERATIDDDTSMEDIASWDSGNHISLVMALEEEFEIMFEIAEIEQMTTYYDIVSTVEGKF